MKNKSKNPLAVALARIVPVWLQRDAMLAKIVERMREAAAEGCGLVAFGEALVPGYPFRVERTDGASRRPTFRTS